MRLNQELIGNIRERKVNMKFYSAAHVLTKLNKWVVIKETNKGLVLQEYVEDEDGKLQAIPSIPSFRWKRSVDWFILGDNGKLPRRSREDAKKFPLGSTKGGGGRKRNWLKVQLSQNHVAPGQHLLVITLNEGNYGEDVQRLLKEQFPRLNWHFPDVLDYAGIISFAAIASDLLKAGILEVYEP